MWVLDDAQLGSCCSTRSCRRARHAVIRLPAAVSEPVQPTVDRVPTRIPTAITLGAPGFPVLGRAAVISASSRRRLRSRRTGPWEPGPTARSSRPIATDLGKPASRACHARPGEPEGLGDLGPGAAYPLQHKMARAYSESQRRHHPPQLPELSGSEEVNRRPGTVPPGNAPARTPASLTHMYISSATARKSTRTLFVTGEA